MEKLNLKHPLFLCGMMGSGKSTVGKEIASALAVDFHDLDSMIIEEAEMSIPQIFETKGEQWFRDIELKLLIRESQKISGVMALGGGSLQSQRVVDHLKIYGWMIFLNVPKSVLLDRLSGDKNRPKLKNRKQNSEELKKTLDTLFEQRLPLYSQAQITVDTNSDSPGEVAENILKKIKIYDGFNRR